jgi:hypothetical protein
VLAVTVVSAAAPFAVLQLVFDNGVTGHLLMPPIEAYNRENFPGNRMAYGPFPEELAVSPSARPQVRDFYDEFIREPLVWYGRVGDTGRRPIVYAYAVERLQPTAEAALPGRLMWVLLPVGLVGLAWRGRTRGASPAAKSDPGELTGRRALLVALVVGGVLLLPALYTFRALWVRFYAIPSAPGFILLALVGLEAVRRRFPAVAAAR